MTESVSRTLAGLRAKAERDPKHRFRALGRLLDRQMLGEAFARLNRQAAPGIDEVRWSEYAEDLERNLQDGFKWRNRRSHRRSVTWTEYADRWRAWRLPVPRLRVRPREGGLPKRPQPAY